MPLLPLDQPLPLSLLCVPAAPAGRRQGGLVRKAPPLQPQESLIWIESWKDLGGSDLKHFAIVWYRIATPGDAGSEHPTTSYLVVDKRKIRKRLREIGSLQP